MTDNTDWDADVSAQSDWESDPSCPKCGSTVDCLGELFDDGTSEGEYECDCGIKLRVEAEYDVSYCLWYEPPTDEEIASEFAAMLARVRSHLSWKAQEPELRRKKELRDQRKAAAAPDWASYDWPSWIPPDLRESIQKFWSMDWGRGPFEWEEDWRSDTPPLGTQVSMGLGSCHEAHGRYVHAWNNMGRVIDANGYIHYCSVQGSDDSGPILLPSSQYSTRTRVPNVAETNRTDPTR